jgi:hypothetical protein
MKFDVRWFTIALIVSLLAFQPSNGFAGFIEDLQNAGQPGSSSAVTSQTNSTPSLSSFTGFSAFGPLAETLADGACSGSLAASTSFCKSSSTACLQLQFSGPVTAAPFTSPNISGCLTIDNTSYDTHLNNCFTAMGTATITGRSGKSSITVAIGGSLCAADAFPLPTPTNEIFNVVATYALESGTGSLGQAAGSGQFSLQFPLSLASVTPPISGSGQLSMKGALAP